MKKDIVILGSKGCAKEVLFLLEDNNEAAAEWNILGFVDEGEGSLCGYPVLGNDDWLLAQEREIYVACGVGCPSLREKIIQKYQEKPKLHFPALISRRAVVGKRVKLGQGCLICAGAILTVDVEIGDFVTVDKNSVVSHEAVLKDYVTVSPGVHISGNVNVEKGVKLGVGSQILQNIHLGTYSVIGAGATVIGDIPPYATAVGCPARVIKRADGSRI